MKVNRQQNNFDVKDYQFSYIPVGEELLELLLELGLEININSNDYIIAPGIENRITLEKVASKSFSFYFKKLKRGYGRKLKHLRQTYVTQKDQFINGRISMQHKII